MNKDYIELLQDENTGEFYEPYATIVCKTEEDFKNMQEALEKQVAKKIEEHNKTCKCRVFDYMDYECTQRVPYCCVCGQKLDWSEAGD